MMTSKSLTKAIRYFAFLVFGIARVATAQDPIERNTDEIVATFSIVAVNPETGIVGAAVASKYPAVGRVVPYVRAC